MLLVTMFFANGTFFCRRSRVSKILANDITTSYEHGGKDHEDIGSRIQGDNFFFKHDDLG